MYEQVSNWVLGFHGTDKDTVDRVLKDSAERLSPSRNSYDWLGEGVYFWEGDPGRALSFIKEKMRRDGDDRKPAVLGAVIDLGLCMNLVVQSALKELKEAHEDLAEDFRAMGRLPPTNEGPTDDLLRRFLDKVVFDNVHILRSRVDQTPYDTVRSPFLEGKPLYDNTLFRTKTHVQIAVRNHRCIKGFFLPRK